VICPIVCLLEVLPSSTKILLNGPASFALKKMQFNHCRTLNSIGTQIEALVRTSHKSADNPLLLKVLKLTKDISMAG